MNLPCDIINDLLPLYYDGVCNETTKKQVDEHLMHCEKCRTLLDKMNNTKIERHITEEKEDVIRHQAKVIRGKYARSIASVFFVGMLLIGMITSVIVDVAISGGLHWAPIPFVSCLFAGIVFLPLIKNGRRGFMATLVLFSVFVVPFLIVLSEWINPGGLMFSLSVSIALPSIIFIWMVFLLFKILRKRKLIAAAISLILSIPFSALINFVIFQLYIMPTTHPNELAPVFYPFDVWDVLGYGIVMVVAFMLILISSIRYKNIKRNQADVHTEHAASMHHADESRKN